MIKSSQKGFTLIELLIVIAIIAILAAVVFVALDPLQRFQDARDARRWSDVDALISAVKLHQVDNGGEYLAAIDALTSAQVYQIGTDTLATTCNTADAAAVTLDCTANGGTQPTQTACADISGLAPIYLAATPIAPSSGGNTFSSVRTGYTIQKTGNNITIRSCLNEGGTEIEITR